MQHHYTGATYTYEFLRAEKIRTKILWTFNSAIFSSFAKITKICVIYTYQVDKKVREVD